MAVINGRIQRRSSRRNANINMTNLMDVMMVLLVVFMVAAPLMTSWMHLAKILSILLTTSMRPLVRLTPLEQSYPVVVMSLLRDLDLLQKQLQMAMILLSFFLRPLATWPTLWMKESLCPLHMKHWQAPRKKPLRSLHVDLWSTTQPMMLSMLVSMPLSR